MSSPSLGLRCQRQVDVLYGASKHFSAGKNKKASLSTGISVEYALHGKDVVGAKDEERVVLIMGFRQAKEAWGATVDQLLETWSTRGDPTKNLRILTPDNRGVGGTDAPWGRYTTSQMAEDVVALLDHLKWDKAHIVGVSMGGMISLEMASLFPKRVKSLSLIVTTRGKYVNENGYEDMKKSILSSDPEVIVNSVVNMLYPPAYVAQKMEDSDAIIRDVLYKFHGYRRLQTQKPKLRGILAQVLAIRTHFVTDERLAGIAKAGFPVLILGAREDTIIPVSESDLLAKHMKGDHVKHIVFEGVGHGVTIQCVDEVNQELLNTFLRSSL